MFLRLDVSGASVPSETSTLNLSAAAKLLSPKSFSHEQSTLPTAAVAPPMEAQSVIPIAKCTPGLAARVMAGVGTRLVTAAPAASLAAQRLLRLRIPPRPDQTAVAVKTLVVRHVTPMARMEAAAQRMDTAESHPITAVPAARTDAVVQTHLQLNLQQHHLRKNPSWAYQPRAPPPTEKRQMAVAVPPTVEPFVAPGRREAVAPHTFCGKTTAHCGKGCQSGPCTDGPSVPAPGPSPAPANPNPGTLRILPASSTNPLVEAGVPPMHAGLMQNGRVIFLDKVEDYTQLKLPNGQFAYSSEYDPATNKVVPLSYKTNAFCSGGAFLADGRFVSIGGNAPLDFLDPTVGDGFDGIRYLTRSATDASLNGQGWSEPGNKIASARWYASVQTMPDSTLFVASGSLNGLDPTKPENNNPTYEVLNAQGVSNGRNIPMEILRKNQPYYMYPFIHLLNNGQLFVQVSKSAEIFNVATNTVTKALPDIPGDYRTYPNTGGSVLLPLSSGNGYAPEVMICGGGAYQDITSPTDPSCGRIQPLAATPKWEMDSMNEGRCMVEGTLLPDGTVIWVNGANQGAQGFGVARTPTYQVLIYDPVKPLGQRWSRGPTSTIARLYHSVAVLLLDGTLMIAGSNPVEQPILKPVPGKVPSEDFVTEFRIEIYTPPYLSGPNANKRPTGLTLSSKSLKADGSTFTVRFTAPAGNKVARVALYHGGFVTHSLHMNHRMVFLDTTGYRAGATSQTLTVKMPPNRNVAHAGPYVVYVTVDGVPAIGQFVSVA
ncbi:MAG: hypothetical protein L6R35_001808 [Caloplaca aegaea]|nr:MAG: hypothetical protein L6R35_001808 [Caloplaca aegaea]